MLDYDSNGIVDLKDMLTWYTFRATQDPAGDISVDGEVDSNDLFMAATVYHFQITGP